MQMRMLAMKLVAACDIKPAAECAVTGSICYFSVSHNLELY